MRLRVEAVEHVQDAAKQAAYAEHTGERAQPSPGAAKQKLQAHWSWFLCAEPGTAPLTGQGDGLLKGCSTVSVRQVSMIPFMPARFSGVVKGAEQPPDRWLLRSSPRRPSTLRRLQVCCDKR